MFNNRKGVKLVVLSLCIILLGCTNDQLGEVNEADLFSRIEQGQAIDDGYLPYLNLSQQPTELGKLLGEAALTGEWFLHDGLGQVGYSIISGYQAPGSQVGVSLFSQSGQVTKTTPLVLSVVPLIVRNGDVRQGNPVIEVSFDQLMIEQETELTTLTLPEDEGVYLLKLESLNNDAVVTDRLLSVFYTVQPKLAMSLNVVNQTSDEAVWEMRNEGQVALTFGVAYRIEKYVDGHWRDVPLDLAFIEIAIELAGGESYKNGFSLSGLTKGEYRLIKTVHAGHDYSSHTLQAPFTIQ
ncbi:hypothetical protein GCM10012290_15870 [Halolactibacillus alkaliphilus]|uniref:Bacterial Ig-like domain-containing protein n=1 Tax=Halolactibacillus alkaliphilus TaxID=442899 RepID=A0A511X1F6_9BACI|nr:immunoglobulin-like domain-containing protein [Halolactibacillus alkaliphilus]GEN56778.1 hypothetical protein HAL01_12420 [Halolactibacillus alkaliphilus]GGN71228.1 hypothetical protein GCM10012290_15870 [Halolactibacillus alkaliphilus]SFO81429.1 hypothetical protein SAMN05720591_11363 [Halolactibacillus alkaliphilus]